MPRYFAAGFLLLLASTGCHVCNNCYDNASPVLDGPCVGQYERVGSVGTHYGSIWPRNSTRPSSSPQEQQEAEGAKDLKASDQEPLPLALHSDD